MTLGATLLTTDDVLPGVADLMSLLTVEGQFPDGPKMITIHNPVRPGSNAATANRTPRRGVDRRRRYRAERAGASALP